ncbi:MAG: aminotransferase class V-fold PLP-dependent enzyme [Lachnospiraceae bacterium]|nr:aminotransferase class V-fold PLP-dependent enzyme [Lachnospiraceae bacterium]
MIYFNSDYLEGAHPRIMELLQQTNMVQTDGYGEDDYCEKARTLIREACQAPNALVQFLVGGTQTNMTVISAALRPHQGVLCAHTGHINVHETGAVESFGHKVLALSGANGKVSADAVRQYVSVHRMDSAFEHMVQPGMVYISHPTETGTLYTRAELTALSEACRELGLYLFLDGARLAYGLAASDSDLDLPTIASLCDVFYIGGTKCGALMGEAVVITHEALKKDFRYLMKQKGGMLAKGRLLGLQFIGLFEKRLVDSTKEDGTTLYEEVGHHTIYLADKLRKAIHEMGISFYNENTTNQIFIVLEDRQVAEISKKFSLGYTERVDDIHSVMRICTSWATKEENVDALIAALKALA